MGWVCKYCSANNEDADDKCFVCDKDKAIAVVSTPTRTEPARTSTSGTPARTASSSGASYAGGGGSSSPVPFWLILIGLGIVGGLLVWLFTIMTWTAWQWVIGILGGALLAGVSVWVSDRIGERYASGIVIAAILTLVNLVLLIICGSEYHIISAIFCAVGAIGSGVGAYFAFDDYEVGWGWFDIGVAAVNLIICLVSCFAFD